MIVYLMSLESSGSTGLVMGLYAEAENHGNIAVNPALGDAYTAFSPASSILLVIYVLILTP